MDDNIPDPVSHQPEPSPYPATIDTLVKDTRWHHAVPCAVEPLLQQALHAVLQTVIPDTKKRFELSILLTDDQEIQRLNAQYRQKNKPTNVLSFQSGIELKAAHNALIPLGDLVFSFDTLVQEAQEQNKPFDHHLIHLCIHGLLHLFGFDHQVDDEAEIMESLEIQILEQFFRIPNPYRHAPIT
jgi:probable rRNA maturation factor